MADHAGRFIWVTRFARVTMILTLVVLAAAFIAGVATTVVGLIDWDSGETEFYWGAAMALGSLVAAVWTILLYGVIVAVIANEVAVASAASRLRRIESLTGEVHTDTAKLADLSQLSDQAKSLIFREREVEAFRESIHADLMRQDYKTAEALADAVESRFGYIEEASRLRQEIEESRKATLQEKIDAAIERIDSILARRDWAQALREANRIIKLFPDNEKVSSLPQRIEEARNDHKRRLLQQYGEAVRRNDVDRGIELLQELDLYLTPQEAAALEESARGVFRAKLHNLGVQFAISVTDARWAEAIATGEQIINEYPNTRMAAEVREKMDQLRARAGIEKGKQG